VSFPSVCESVVDLDACSQLCTSGLSNRYASNVAAAKSILLSGLVSFVSFEESSLIMLLALRTSQQTADLKAICNDFKLYKQSHLEFDPSAPTLFD